MTPEQVLVLLVELADLRLRVDRAEAAARQAVAERDALRAQVDSSGTPTAIL